MAAPQMKLVDQRTFEVVCAWYSIFITVMDASEFTEAERLEKLRLLRARLKKELPGLEFS